MSIRIVRLGSPRAADEGLRIGTVRRPPRGVPKAEFASRDFYDVWLPNLSPSAELVAQAQAATSPADWRNFERKFRAEMNEGEASKVLDLLADCVRQVNADLAAEEGMEDTQIARFLILHKELDPDDDEMTRTRKVRRGFVADKYKVLIDALYGGMAEQYIETQVKFEDGRTGAVSATLKLRDVPRQTATAGATSTGGKA